MGVVAIFSYSFEKAKLAFEEKDCQLETIADYNDLISEAQNTNYINETDANLLSTWNKNPQVWSENYIKSLG